MKNGATGNRRVLQYTTSISERKLFCFDMNMYSMVSKTDKKWAGIRDGVSVTLINYSKTKTRNTMIARYVCAFSVNNQLYCTCTVDGAHVEM